MLAVGDALPFVDLGAGRTFMAVTGGRAFNCALLDNGRVKCWGGNAQGQLGLGNTASIGNTNHRDTPGEMGDALPFVDLATDRTAKAISAGRNHVCVSLDNGRFKCWGDNFRGTLGLGDTDNRGDAPGEMGDALPFLDLGN